jgi:alpha-tubulin suppressor-like RCC1 family protein
MSSRKFFHVPACCCGALILLAGSSNLAAASFIGEAAEYPYTIRTMSGAPIPSFAGSVAAIARSLTNVPPGLTNIIEISVRGWNNLALREDGTVVSWSEASDVPWRLDDNPIPGSLSNVAQVAAGSRFSLALTAGGRVVGWGENDLAATVPENLSNAVEIAAGAAHGLARTADGRIVGWGYRMDHPDNVPANLSNVVAIAAGHGFSLALRSDGSVVYWTDTGRVTTLNESHILSIAANYCAAMLRADGTVLTYYPAVGVAEAATNMVAVTMGRFLFALRPDGSVHYTSGFEPAADLANVVGLAAGENHALALVGDGRPTPLAGVFPRTAFTGHRVIMNARVAGATPLSYQWFHNSQKLAGATNAILHLESVTLSDSGSYVVTAENPLGSISVTNTVLEVAEISPFIMESPAGYTSYPGGLAKFAVRANGSHPLAYQWLFEGEAIPGATNDTLNLNDLCFDDAGLYRVEVSNAFGKVSSEDVLLRVGPLVPMGYWSSPDPHCFSRPAHVPPDASDVVAVACGHYHTVGLRRDGTVTSWGFRDNWCSWVNPPLEVPSGLSNIVAVAAGEYHSFALSNDGTIAAWGELGWQGMHVPPPLSNVVAVAARGMFNAALLADGKVAAWGGFGADVPADLTNAVAIAVGRSGLALTSDRRLAAFGLGSAYWQDRLSDLTNIVGIAAGFRHMVALDGEGNVTVRSASSSLGEDVPLDATNIVAVAAGYANTLALRADGRIVGWGQQGPVSPPDLSNVTSLWAGDYQAIARVERVGLPPAAGLHLRAVRLNEGQFTVHVETVPGAIYLLESTDSLTDQEWRLQKPLVLGDGTVKLLTGGAPESRQRFFRARLLR